MTTRRALAHRIAVFGARRTRGGTAPAPGIAGLAPLRASPEVPAQFVGAFSNWRDIVQSVLARHGVTLAQVRVRRGDNATARLAGWELCYRLSRWGRRGGLPITQTEVARILHRDRSTVAYGMARYVRLRGFEP